MQFLFLPVATAVLGAPSSVTTDKASYNSGETIVATFNRGSTPVTTDWLGIYPASAGAPDGTPPATTWQYVCGGSSVCQTAIGSGSVSFTYTLGAGDWVVWYLANNGYSSLDSAAFTVSRSAPSCAAATSAVSSKTHVYATDGAVVDTVAFSSCYKPSTVSDGTVWADMRNTVDPDVWVWLGDNMYADGTDMQTKRVAYNAARDQPYYGSVGPIAMSKIPVMATWDDHDFGANNQGIEYACLAASQNEFVTHFNVPPSDPMHKDHATGQRRGVYNARMFTKPDGITNGVHAIMLDARTDRDPTFASYGTCKGAASRILSDAQWAWLDAELAKTSEIKIIGSGIQVLPPTDQQRALTSYCAYDGAGGTFEQAIADVGESRDYLGTAYESWAEIPQQRAKLLQKVQQCINSGHAKQVVFVSGDQHRREPEVE